MSEKSMRVLSFLTPEQAAAFGKLPPESVVGVFTDERLEEQGFQANRLFIDFMHDIIRRAGPRTRGCAPAPPHRREAGST
jgi:hypothetical protein